MGDFVRNVDLMKEVENSTAPLKEMLGHNDLQGAAAKLRADLSTMDHDSFMIELGEVQRSTADTPTHIVMRPLTDESGITTGKDIALVSRGVDANQNPIDCNIPIGQLYADRSVPCPQPLVVRPDCAFQLSYRQGDGWYRRDDGALLFGGRFPDGRVHLDVGGLNINIGAGFGSGFGRTTVIENVHVNRVPNFVRDPREVDHHKRP
jgi:hypothetical protein